MEQLECGVGRRLVIGIVGHDGAHRIGRENLGRQEVARRERALAGSARTDQHDHRVGGDANDQTPSLQRERGASSSGPSFRTLLTAGETA